MGLLLAVVGLGVTVTSVGRPNSFSRFTVSELNSSAFSLITFGARCALIEVIRSFQHFGAESHKCNCEPFTCIWNISIWRK